MVTRDVVRFAAGRFPARTAAFFILVALFVAQACAQQPADFDRHLASGEFTIALKMARSAVEPQLRDRMFASLAAAQRTSGNADNALRNAVEIGNDQWRATTLARLSSFGNSLPPGGSGLDGIGPERGFGPGPPRGGGITEADFTDLIDLIQETIDPDSWDDAGGSGRIRAFPSGVLVDPEGVMKAISPESGRRLDEIRESVDVIDDLSLDRQTAFRAISLTRLERVLQLRAARGQVPLPEMACLGGIYQLQYVMLFPETRDVVIAGPAGPWHYDSSGRAINTETGRPVLNLDDFVVCLRNAARDDGRFGCSIDPRPENLSRAREFIGTSTLKGPVWRDRLRDIIGVQDVVVNGIDPATHAARVIVEADYHMKRIGMGLAAGVDGLDNYFQRLHLDDKGNPPRDDSLVRWWFTMNYEAIQTNEDRTVFEIDGQGVRLLSESEFWTEQGDRVHTGQSSAAAGGFAKDFTRHFDELCVKYPLYGELKNLFDSALAANLIYREGLNRQIEWNLNHFQEQSRGGLLGYVPAVHRTPRMVDSLTGQRVIRQELAGRTRTHTITGISGGVEFDAADLVKRERITVAESPELTTRRFSAQPDADQTVTDWTWEGRR